RTRMLVKDAEPSAASARSLARKYGSMRMTILGALLAALATVTASATEAAKAQGMSAPPAPSAKAQRSDADAIRPFSVHVPDEALTDLRRRLVATRWPDRETVSDRSQGAPLDDFKELVRYWGTGYDWRRGEAKLDALPQFVTSIDGLDIH